MRNRLTTLAWLSLLGVVGFMAFPLTQGQTTVHQIPLVVKPAAKPIVVAPARVPDPVPPKKAGLELSKLTTLQKQMYFSARRGANWLDRMNNVKGRFDHGLQPALNLALEGDHPLRQAGAAFALARAARFLDDDGHAARARQAILVLLADTVQDNEKKVRHSLLPSTVINRLSHAALLVLAIHELPAPDADLLATAEQLCEFIRRQQRVDGSLRCREALAGAPENDETEEVSIYPGQALCALARSQARRPEAWKTRVVQKALPYYLKWWREHKGREFVAWHSAAFAETLLATEDRAFADAVFEMNDWLCRLQFDRLEPSHPQWLGSFQNVIDGKATGTAPNVTSAVCLEALAEATRVAAQQGDLARHKRYTAALELGLQFLSSLQYSEADTQHFADWYRPRLLGGFHFDHRDGTLRIDHTQHALCALVQYLRHVAEVR